MATDVNQTQPRPITLNILPKQPIPTFQYAPVIPHVPDNPYNLKPGISLEEKERYRMERDRQRSSNYYNKIKSYKKLGTLGSEREKIIALLLLCYPSLREMNSSDLERRVVQFIDSLSKT